jgi:hypothetical protein
VVFALNVGMMGSEFASKIFDFKDQKYQTLIESYNLLKNFVGILFLLKILIHNFKISIQLF